MVIMIFMLTRVGMDTNPMMNPVGRDDTPPTQEQEHQT
ncbi:MAG: hypothetical protein Ct9H300mP21_00720 [Pseudomonadota bacterium]|nr:MAG: hypothetical protein Ct9H300mP21_00720 [Pseudomonadota bacterium]